MKIKRLNGLELEKMLKNGLNLLRNHEDEINALNVFPVPDGDTGTNMRLTLQHGLEQAQSAKEIGVFLKGLSDGMLLGARGNSGVILSQLFRGIFLELQRARAVDCGDIRNALIRGYKTAYQAVVRPVEGTILTVSREGIENIRQQISRATSIDELFGMYVAEMKTSLQKTPDLLPVLKEAGVIDSGAKGYITIVEGMQKYLYGEFVDAVAKDEREQDETCVVDRTLFNADSAFEDGYCCEFVLQLMNGRNYANRFRENVFVEDLKAYGNSIVCVRNEDRVKVHVHAMKPGKILAIAQEYGEFLTLKIENMQIQHNETNRKALKKAAIHKPMASCAVSNGEGFGELFTQLGCDIVLEGGMTMNTSSSDFVEAFRALDADVITVFPNNKNILMAAQQAASLCPDLHIEIIPTKNQASCYAALQMDIQDNPDTEYRLSLIRQGSERMEVIEIAEATRDYTNNNIACKEGEIIALCNSSVVAGGRELPEVILSALNSLEDIEERETLIVFEGADADRSIEDDLTEAIQEEYPLLEVSFIPGEQPIYPYVLGLM